MITESKGGVNRNLRPREKSNYSHRSADKMEKTGIKWHALAENSKNWKISTTLIPPGGWIRKEQARECLPQSYRMNL
jgi:hypothetical protein